MSLVKSLTHQPKGVMLSFGLQLLGMIGFTMIYALVVLYCTNQLGFSDHNAYAISASFNALAFAMSVPGGLIAEKYLGFKSATVLSFILCLVGLSVIALHSTMALYIGLGIFIMGTGMTVPCLYVLLGYLYKDDQVLIREQGFTLSYIGMNAGSFMASVFSGSISQHFGYGFAFALGASASVIMLPLFLKNQHLFEHGENFHAPNQHAWNKGVILSTLSCFATATLVYYANACNALVIIVGCACIAYIIKLAMAYDAKSKAKLIVFIILTVISIMFWTLYSLSPSALTIFTERNVDRHLFGSLIPTADFTSLNPFFIITLGPMTGLIFGYLKTKNIELSLPIKFAIGTALMGFGYLILVPGIHFSSSTGMTALIWLVLSYFLQTAGELLVGPVGYAMVGLLTPKDQQGFMMGFWQLACGISGALSEYLANATVPSQHSSNPLITNPSYAHAFFYFGAATLAVAVITFVISPKLQQYCEHEHKEKTCINHQPALQS